MVVLMFFLVYNYFYKLLMGGSYEKDSCNIIMSWGWIM